MLVTKSSGIVRHNFAIDERLFELWEAIDVGSRNNNFLRRHYVAARSISSLIVHT